MDHWTFVPANSAESSGHTDLDTVPELIRRACLLEATQRLTPDLLHIVQQPTIKGRDRALAALVVTIYGPDSFDGAESVRDVAVRYGLTDRQLSEKIEEIRLLLNPDRDIMTGDGAGI